MFNDRADAGEKLAEALTQYRGNDTLILAIPRGGVEVACQAAEKLQVPLSIIIVRKLPFPQNPEAGFGAVAEDGSIYFDDWAYRSVLSEEIVEIIEEQKQELERRIDVLREGKPLPEIKGKTVILVDDGIAMGSTMRAAVMLCNKQRAKKVIAAAPVAGPDTAKELKDRVDDLVVLKKPPHFRAVAEVYKKWYDVQDKEVIRLLKNCKWFADL